MCGYDEEESLGQQNHKMKSLVYNSLHGKATIFLFIYFANTTYSHSVITSTIQTCNINHYFANKVQRQFYNTKLDKD